MWTRTHSKIYPGVKKEAIWRLWSDVNNWTNWQEDLDSCKMSGPFAAGNHFLLKPKGAPTFKIKLIEVQEGKKFTDCTKFFGAKMYDTHALEETPEGLRLTSTLVVTGPLQFLWAKLVAQNIANTLPQQMDALVSFARSGNT